MKQNHNEFWMGDFGDKYTKRNTGNIDKVYEERFGLTRTNINYPFLSDMDKDISILEVGCNNGLQLDVLKKDGFTNLWGIDINQKALNQVRKDTSLNIVEGSALDIPFKDQYFDVVFTSGVLIHIPPKNLFQVVDELYRVTKKYIWCYEYFAEKCQEIVYRLHKNKLWKNNFIKLF